MTIYFICRGNVFRSMIATTYLKSLNIPNVTVLSGGTVASKYKKANAAFFPKLLALLKAHGIEKYAKDHYGDDVNQDLLDAADRVICLNKIVYQELQNFFIVPAGTYVWDVADVDEPGHVIETDADREAYKEEAYEQIVKKVDDFVSTLGDLK